MDEGPRRLAGSFVVPAPNARPDTRPVIDITVTVVLVSRLQDISSSLHNDANGSRESSMKRILVVCGTGVATSTVVVSKIRDHLQSKGLQADIRQGKVMDLVNGNFEADLIVATTEVPASVTVPTVAALPLLTGVGVDAVFAEIDKHLS